MQFGIGFSYIEPILNSNLLIDFLNDKNNGTIMRFGFIKTSRFIKYNIGLSKNKDTLIYGLGSSFKYKKWGLNISLASHNNTIFNFSQYIDLVWYF